MMTDLRDSDLASHHLENAIESSCVALVKLELIRCASGDGADEIRSAESQIRQVIASVRSALAELRLEHGDEESALAFGFVVEADRGQSRRRRCN
jgi:signal transduction histidine kinase